MDACTSVGYACNSLCVCVCVCVPFVINGVHVCVRVILALVPTTNHREFNDNSMINDLVNAYLLQFLGKVYKFMDP